MFEIEYLINNSILKILKKFEDLSLGILFL